MLSAPDLEVLFANQAMGLKTEEEGDYTSWRSFFSNIKQNTVADLCAEALSCKSGLQSPKTATHSSEPKLRSQTHLYRQVDRSEWLLSSTAERLHHGMVT